MEVGTSAPDQHQGVYRYIARYSAPTDRIDGRQVRANYLS